MQLFSVPEKSSQELPLFLEFIHLKPNETIKSSIGTLNMTFERMLKDFKVSYLVETQVWPIAFAQVPRISKFKFLILFVFSHKGMRFCTMCKYIVVVKYKDWSFRYNHMKSIYLTFTF